MANLTPEIAGKIYDILVEHAAAPQGEPGDNYDREDFIYSQSSEYITEWRFMGALGFGGKFWRTTPWQEGTQHLAELWFVNCYPEHMTAERKAIIERANAALAALNEEVGPRREW